MELRWYQTSAVGAVWDYLRNRGGNPCVVLPTGSGKTPVIAKLCKEAVEQWQGRVLILAHVRELLEQTAEKLRIICPEISFGVYSAGLKKRETTQQVIVAGIQSVYERAQELGFFDLILIDECHLITDSGDGMYRTLIEGLSEINPDIRVVGLTATPYRMGSGLICGEDRILKEVCYEVGVKALIHQGYLCKLTSKAAVGEVSTGGLRVVRGEYVDGEAEARFMAEGVIPAACREIVEKTRDRKSVLIFCQTIAHAEQVRTELSSALAVSVESVAKREIDAAKAQFGDLNLFDSQLYMVADYLQENNKPHLATARVAAHGLERVRHVFGDTPSSERAEILKQFKEGRIKYLVNVGVLTTGFDAANADCVVLLRATASPGLYYQMCGRGFRVHPDKQDCLVLDFGTNIRRHGPVDAVEKKAAKKKGELEISGARMCPECREMVSFGVRVCPSCGLGFVAEQLSPSHDASAGNDDIISGEASEETYDVGSVDYKVHTKRGAQPGHPKTLRVTYQISLTGSVSEWVCIEHPRGGFAHRKACAWWALRCQYPIPGTVLEAVVMADHGLLAAPMRVKTRTRPGEKYPEIVGVELGDKPRTSAPCPGCRKRNSQVIVDTHDSPHFGSVRCNQCDHFFGWASREMADKLGFGTGLLGAIGIDEPEPEPWEDVPF